MRASIALGIAFIFGINLVVAGGGNIPKKEDIPKYLKTLSNPSAKANDKRDAVDMIAKRGAINAKDVQDAIEPIMNLAEKDKDAVVRKSAVHALGSIAPDPDVTVPLLTKVLKSDKAQDVKFAAVEALGRFGPKAKSALPAIRDFGNTLDKKEKGMIKTATAAISGNKK